MDNSLFINLFARLLLVVCPVVAFRFARRRSLRSWQVLLLCAAAAALANVLFAATVALTGMMWIPPTDSFASAVARAAAKYAAGGLLFGAVCLWRRVASTSRLFLIALVMVAAVDVLRIGLDSIFGLPKNEARPVMVVISLLVGSLIYVWSPGDERDLPAANATQRRSTGHELAGEE